VSLGPLECTHVRQRPSTMETRIKIEVTNRLKQGFQYSTPYVFLLAMKANLVSCYQQDNTY